MSAVGAAPASRRHCSLCIGYEQIIEDGDKIACPNCCCHECGEVLAEDECPKGCGAPGLTTAQEIGEAA